MLSFFDSITGSYALALLFYALIFKIVFLPFSVKQQKNQIKMAKLAPKIQLIRAKYKGRTDQPTMQKQQQEIMDLQRQEGYSPFSGCLPLLIQLPLIMLLYTVIQNPLSYIAKTNDTVNNYNDNRESIKIEELDPDFYERYKTLIDENDEITKDDITLALYKEFYPMSIDEGDYKSTEEYEKALNEIADADKIPGNTEIALIGIIEDFIDGENSDAFPSKDSRLAYVGNFGINHDTYPNFYMFGVNLAAKPSFSPITPLVIIPFLAAISSWLSMWLTRKFNGNNLQNPEDKQTAMSMKMMDLMMPALTLWMAFSFSGMLGLYWVFQSLLGLLQSFIISRIMPLPKYTEEEIKEMHRQQREVEKAQRAAAKAQPKHKSLHYIDDDDYEELPVIESPEENKKTPKFNSETPEIKD